MAAHDRPASHRRAGAAFERGIRPVSDVSTSRRLAIAGSTFILVVALAWGPPYDLLALATYGAVLGVPGVIRHRIDTPREVKLWFFAASLYAGTILLAVARSSSDAGPGSESLRIFTLLLAVPACYAAMHRDMHAAGWWWAVAAVPLVIGARLIASPPLSVATHVLAFLFGALALTSIGHFRQYGAAFVVVPIASFMVALLVAWSGIASMPDGVTGLPGDAWRRLQCHDTRLCAEYVEAWRRGGVLESFALLLFFVLPALRFGRDLNHRARAVRCLAGAGMVIVVVVAAASTVAPVFSNGTLLTAYVGLVAMLHGVMTSELAEHYARPVRRSLTLSATVICRNEADRIAACLASLSGWVDEIIVFDSGSTDGTAEIARRYTSSVYVTDWPGFGPQKQRALEAATCDWVLSIDADEVVTPELAHDIDAALSEQPAEVGFRVPWAIVAYGRRLDFGNAGRSPLRLFRRQGSRFSDDVVHERVITPAGPVGTLRGRLLHCTLRDYRHWLQKSADYAWLAAQQRMREGRRGSGPVIATLRAFTVFVQTYILRLGVLDGAVGYLNAVNAAQYTFNKYAGLWTLRRAQDAGEPTSRGPRRG